MKRSIAILQPVYLPWLGYFEQMALVDHFVFLDDVQYTHHNWRNRNRVKTDQGVRWLTVPVSKCKLETPILEVEVHNHLNWQRKQLKTVEQAYAKCDHFQPLFDDLANALMHPPALLRDLDIDLIKTLCRHLKITTPTSLSSLIPKDNSDANSRVLEICLHHHASVLYNGARSVDYLDVELFKKNGIEVVFQDYRHPVYRQRFGPFVSHLSAIDLIMNEGPDAASILRSSPCPRLLR